MVSGERSSHAIGLLADSPLTIFDVFYCCCVSFVFILFVYSYEWFFLELKEQKCDGPLVLEVTIWT